MKYYLVALLDKDSCKQLEPIQKSFSKRYKIYKGIIKPYIFLHSLENPDIDKLDKLMCNLLTPYKKFKVELDYISYKGNPCRELNLNIESKGYIGRFNRKIDDILITNGFNSPSAENSQVMSICLANTTQGLKDFTNEQFKIIPNSKPCFDTLKIDRVELWKLSNGKKPSILKSYTLRDY